jgi:lipopolysaccharide transport system ATP-binding protein
MSDVAIRVENLSKWYRIGAAKQRHNTLRDQLTYRLKSLFSRNGRHRPEANSIWALKDVSFEIKKGEVVGIIGRNGAGKSTLLKILSRITVPTKGRAEIYGRVGSLLEVGTGFHPELSGGENIYLNGAILGMRKKEIDRRFDEIVAFAEIEKFIHTPVKHYSSGMYMRLAFAVAAHLEPEILIVDEVLAVGDAAFQKKCLGKMSDVASEGRTVLFVSHNLSAVQQLCPTSFWLNGGQIEAYGHTADVVASYLQGLDKSFQKRTPFFPEDTAKESQLRSARILNQKGEETDNFSCDEPVVIELLYEVRRQVPGLYGYLSVSRDDGIEVIVSVSQDTVPNPFDNLGVGTHAVVVTIPARTLGHGTYRIYFATGSRLRDGNVDIPGIIGRFRLDDYTSIRGNNRRGLMSTLLTWRVKATASTTEWKMARDKTAFV